MGIVSHSDNNSLANLFDLIVVRSFTGNAGETYFEASSDVQTIECFMDERSGRSIGKRDDRP